jgi:uncharacterized protein YjbI with pentapeptide repeats
LRYGKSARIVQNQARIDRPVDKRRASHPLPLPRFCPQRCEQGALSHADPTMLARAHVVDCRPNLVANPEHLELLRQGVDLWNAWRAKEPSVEAELSGADLHGTLLDEANLNWANLAGANLDEANLFNANLIGVNLRRANLRRASLSRANLFQAKLSGADLSQATLAGATLYEANLSRANLRGADLFGASLIEADLSGVDLTKADLSRAILVETNLVDATLTDCRIYGISAWDVKRSEGTIQQGLIITRKGEPAVTVDDLEVAQFVYLLLHNDKIRHVIDTVGKKGVLLLGRFTEGRIVVLERLRDELRKRGYLPIVFNFDKPETKDFTETVRLLAGLSKFVIADLTSPKSAPYELGAIVCQTMIPFQPIIEAGETPFAMLRDLLTSYPDRVFQPIEYPSVERLVETMDEEIIGPAEARFGELLTRRAETFKVRRV